MYTYLHILDSTTISLPLDKTNICAELRSVSGNNIQVGRITMPTDKLVIIDSIQLLLP